MKDFSPREIQQPIINIILGRKRANIFASPGTGKTSAVLYALEALDCLDDDVYPVLVVAPLRVANIVWPDEVSSWRQFSHLTISKVTGNQKERINALKAKADIYVINYDNLQWLDKTLTAWTFKTCIVDEATKIAGHRVSCFGKDGENLRVAGTKNARALVKHLKDFKRWYNLTGSPVTNNLENIWAIQFPIDKGDRLMPSFTSFRNKWFRIKPGSKPEYQQYEPMIGSQKEIAERLKDCSVVLNAYDYFDTDKAIIRNIKVELPEKVKPLYKEMLNNMICDLGDEPITAVNAGAKMMKCRQIASGCLRNDLGEWNTVHDEKIKALKELKEELNEPLLVAYHFKESAKAIMKEFPDAVVLTSNKDALDTVKAWNDGKINMLLVSPQSAGHGLSMQHGGRHLVIYDVDWNLELFEQVVERLGPIRQKQSGYNRMVYVHRFITKDTVDETIIKALDNKQDISIAVMNMIKGVTK